MKLESLDFDLRSPEFLADPHPYYAMLRSFAPILYAEDLGAWIISDYESCRTLIRDPRMGHASAPENPFIFQNPPEHTRLRRLTSRVFTKEYIDAHKGPIQQRMGNIIGRLKGKDELDLMQHIAFPFPVEVISEFFQFPLEDFDNLLRWSHAMELCFDPLQDVNNAPAIIDARNEFAEYLHALCKKRMANPGDDMLTGLMNVEIDGDRLAPEEVISTTILLLVAGYITTANLIGNGMLGLLNHPDQMLRLREQPEHLDTAVEEMLRWDPPGHVGHRFALEEIQYGDHTIEKGSLVFFIVAAANRDPEMFEDPETFDITRKKNPHLGFGAGIHACIGAVLGHLEGKIAFRTMLNEWPNISFADEKHEFYETFVFRALKKLPIKVAN